LAVSIMHLFFFGSASGAWASKSALNAIPTISYSVGISYN
jgi:hypothetical protein